MIAAILHSSLIVSASSCLKMLSVRIVMLVCSFPLFSRSLAARKFTKVSELKKIWWRRCAKCFIRFYIMWIVSQKMKNSLLLIQISTWFWIKSDQHSAACVIFSMLCFFDKQAKFLSTEMRSVNFATLEIRFYVTDDHASYNDRWRRFMRIQSLR